MLLDLVSKEMTSTWLEEDDNVVSKTQPRASSATMSAEDIFYAQLNGEMVDGAPIANEVDPASHDLAGSAASGLEYDGDGSFGALTIPDEMRASPKKIERRSSATSGSKASSREKSSRRGSVVSKGTSLSGTSISVSSRSSEEDTLSIQEIQDYVMKNMPPEVRNKIPKEAWAQIFGKSLPDKTRKPSTKKVEEEVEEEDDSSVVSDITEFTMHPGAIGAIPDIERALKPEEVDWDEEVCPGFDKSERTRDADTRSRASSAGSGTGFMLDHTGSIRSSSGKGKVSFSHVQVRYYERILEINPAVTSGPAVGIGWKFKRGGSLHVDDWELQRGGNLRRSTELLIPRPMREKMLKNAGYDQKQIAEAVRIIRKAKDRRKVTVQNLGAGTETMEETVEAASRRIKGLLSFGRNKGLIKN
jgi:hypothetical protein